MSVTTLAVRSAIVITVPALVSVIASSWFGYQGNRVLIFAWILASLVSINAVFSEWATNNWRWSNTGPAWKWDTEIAVITGGSSAIGFGGLTARKLARHGVRVAVLDIAPLSPELEKEPNISYYHCDVRNHKSIRRVAEAIKGDLGPPSILINNAGIGNAHTILEASPEWLLATMEINLLSSWYTVQAFLPDMIKQRKGHVMAIASLAAFNGMASSGDYSAAKAGLMAFHETLGQELKHRYRCPEIKTSIVYPFFARSSFTKSLQQGLVKLGADLLDPDTVAEAMVSQILAAKSGAVYLPKVLGFMTSMVRALPWWAQELARDSTAEMVKIHATTISHEAITRKGGE